MSKTKKAPTFQYGIEITKPHSQEMYDHNKSVATDMNCHIDIALTKAYKSGNQEKLEEIVKCFTGYGFGDGYDIKEIYDTGVQDVLNAQNWTLHEEYSWLCFKGHVPKLKQGMVGHKSVGEKKYEYWTDNRTWGWTDNGNNIDLKSKILIPVISEAIKNIDGAELGYVNKGSDSEYPYVKVDTKYEGEEVVNALESVGIVSEVDLYEDDDGEGDGGRPIIIQRWSVKLIENDWIPNC